MKKKISMIQIFRFFTQVIFLIFLPGLFTLTFSELKTVYLMVLKGDFNFIQAFPRLIAAAAIIPITILLGRFFCGWFCAFGAFNDFLYLITKKVFRIKFRVNEKLNYVLSYVKYLVLAVAVYFIWTKGSTFFGALNPWDAFAQITNFPQAIFQNTAAFIVLAAIAIGALFIERFFCRYLCPLGAVFAVISKLSLIKINKPTAQCGKCRLCTNNCSMGIALYKKGKVNSGECINCLKCIDTCKGKNTAVSVLNEKVNPALAGAAAIVAFASVYSVSNVLGHVVNGREASMQDELNKSQIETNASQDSIQNSAEEGTDSGSDTDVNASASSVSKVTQGKYKDGTYTGTGYGFRPGLKVAVTVKSDKITNVEVLSLNDTRGYYEEPVNVVPKEIVQGQSTRVDAVSGATRTSHGIMMAVEDALSKAKN